MKKTDLLILISSLSSFLLGGCSSSYGIKVDSEKYNQIIEGQTSLQQMKNILGEPQTVMEDVVQKKYIEEKILPATCGNIGDRVTAYIYNFTKSEFSTSSMEMKRFLVNKNNKVCWKQAFQHGI